MRATSKSAPVEFEGADRLADEILSDRPSMADDDLSLSAVLEAFPSFSPKDAMVGAPMNDEPTELMTAMAVELHGPASLGPNSAERKPTVRRSRLPSEVIRRAVVSAEARRLEVAPRVEVDEPSRLPRGLALAVLALTLLGLALGYALG